MTTTNRLYRDEQHKKLAGVCAGLAIYFNVDVSLVRVLFVLAAIFGGTGGIAYAILWVVLPNQPFVATGADDHFFNPAGPLPTSPVYTPGHRPIGTGSIIGGIILIALGGFFMLDQLDIIPNLDFNTFWPLVMIIIGLVLMFGFWQRHPAQTNTWGSTTDNDNISSTGNSQTI